MWKNDEKCQQKLRIDKKTSKKNRKCTKSGHFWSAQANGPKSKQKFEKSGFFGFFGPKP